MPDTPEDSRRAAQPGPGSRLERRFEGFLWNSRFLVMLAVIPSLVGALVLFVIGTVDIFSVLVDAVSYYTLGGVEDIHETVVTDIIIAVDIYLIAIVLMIFAFGIYRLFVSEVEQSESHSPKHPFNVHSFDELKDKIVRVVILAVIIEFFRAVTDIHFETALDAIYLAVSALALAASLFLMSLSNKKE